jgi:hypothetical protein
MLRLAATLLLTLLAACSTTSTVHQPLPQTGGSARVYAYTFENNGGDDLEGIAKLNRIIQGRLRDAGLLAAGAAPDGRVAVELTHFYVRSNGARFWAGIMAGRDKITSNVKVFDQDGKESGSFEVETTNVSAWGSTEGLMEKHADEIVARLKD